MRERDNETERVETGTEATRERDSLRERDNETERVSKATSK